MLYNQISLTYPHTSAVDEIVNKVRELNIQGSSIYSIIADLLYYSYEKNYILGKVRELDI